MLIKWIQKMFKHSFEKEWYETYWAIDIHGVIFRPNYRKNDLHADFYPYAKEVLQLISSKRPDIILIMFTSSYPTEIEYYKNVFKENGINFKYINENPEIDSSKGNFGCYDKKFYFNVLIDDKCGFEPEEWEDIYNLFIEYEKTNYKPNPNWSFKYKEDYHK